MPYPSWLTPERRNGLNDALAEVAGPRANALELLRRIAYPEAAVPNHPEPLTLWSKILADMAAGTHPSGADAFTALVRAAHDLYPGNPTFAATLAAERTARAPAQLQRLLPLLDGLELSAQAVRACYERTRRCLHERPDIPRAADATERARTYAAALADATWTPGGNHPLLDFVATLSAALPLTSPRRDLLAAWLTAAGAALEARGAAAPAPTGGGVPYLLITVRAQETSYSVRAWLFWEAAPETRRGLPLGDPIDCTRADLPALVEELCDLAERRYEELVAEDHQADLRLELALPRALLCAGVEEWQDQGDDPLGLSLPLALRAERDRKAARRLRQRWQRILSAPLGTKDFPGALKAGALDADGLPPAGPPEAVWVDVDGLTPTALRSALRHSSHARVACAILSRAPRESARGDALAQLLAAGIPAALWSRDGDPRARAELERLVEGRFLSSLSAGAQDARLAAQGRGEAWHVGRHLSLLYEDPNRAPPDRRRRNRLRGASA